MTEETGKTNTEIGFEQEQRRKTAEIVALTSGGNFDFAVKFGPKGGGSHWDPANREYVFDSEILDYPLDASMGVIQHEANHEMVSDLEPVMDTWPQLGFSFGFNAVEDPRANQGGMKIMPGTRPWIQAYIEKDLSPGGGLDYKNIKEDTRKKIGYVPKFMQAGAEFIRYWHEREFAHKIADPKADPSKFEQDFEQFLSEIPDKDVRDFIKGAASQFEDYYHTTAASRDQAERKKYAKDAADNFKKKVWPDYQKLVDKSVKDQAMTNFIKDQMGKKQQQQGQGQGGQPMVIPFDSLPEDVKQEIRQKMQEDKQTKEGEKQKQKGAQGQPSAGTPAQPQTGERQGEGKEGQREEKGDQAKDQQNTSKEKQGSAAETGEEQKGKDQVPWDKLSDRAKKEVEKVFDGKNTKGEKVSNEDKDKYKQEAQKDLEDAEDSANEKLRGGMNDPRQTETHKEKKERQSQEEQEKQKEKAQKEVEQIDKREKKIVEAMEKNPYNEFKVMTDVEATIKIWKSRLQRLFEPTVNPEKKFGSTGYKLSLSGARKHAADKRYDKIWEIKGHPTLKDFRYSILVDLSGSMKDAGKIEETFKTVVAFSEVANTFGLEFEIIGFTDTLPHGVKMYKRFKDKKLNRQIRDKIGEIYGDCLSIGGGTPTREATLIAYRSLTERIQRRPMQNNYFITLTDGQCTTCSAEEMIQTIDRIKKTRLVVPAGLGIGRGTDFVNRSYPALPARVRQSIASKLGKGIDDVGGSFPDIHDFSRAFPIIIDYMIRQPGLFFRTSKT